MHTAGKAGFVAERERGKDQERAKKETRGEEGEKERKNGEKELADFEPDAFRPSETRVEKEKVGKMSCCIGQYGHEYATQI